MVALVERDGFCIKADSLLKVSCLAGGVALTDLNIKLSSEIGIQKKFIIFRFSCCQYHLSFSPFQGRELCWPLPWPTQRPFRLAPEKQQNYKDAFNFIVN